MENVDIIILTIMVVVSFVVFIATSLKEFNKMEEKPYEFEKASGFTRAALFNVLSSFFDDDEIPEKIREKFKSTIKRTISDMETDGMYFDEKIKKPISKDKPKNRPDVED
ncbi:hypothetical protein [Aquiflexum sp.]|uniref:hypothetical protein n=1 Tax=Aquiflexum sp. TaxID=1872584 RepID=UPI003594448A